MSPRALVRLCNLWITLSTGVDNFAFAQGARTRPYSPAIHRYAGADQVLCTTVNTTSSVHAPTTSARPARGDHARIIDDNPKAVGRRGVSYTGGR